MESIVNDKCNQLQVTPDNLNLLAREVKKSLSYREFEANIPRRRKKKNKWMGRYCNINKQHSIQGWAASEFELECLECVRSQYTVLFP